MATELQQIADLLKEIKRTVDSLPTNLKVAAQQVFASNLAQITPNAGLLTSGEFRTGNGKEPGQGFTGMRRAYPPMLYAGELWDDVAVNNDVLQDGVKATDGKRYFAGGDAVLDSTGLNFNRLNYAFRQTATNEGNTRIGKVSMTTLTGSTIPVLSIEYGTPITTEICLNGGAELNAFTNWTKTKEIRGAWSVVTSPKYEGDYAFAWTPSAGGSLGILTSDRMVVTDTTSWRASGVLYNSTVIDNGYGIIYVYWYDAESGGTFLRADIIGRLEFTTTGWILYDESKTPPTGALSAEYVIVIGDITDE